MADVKFDSCLYPVYSIYIWIRPVKREYETWLERENII